MARAVAVHLKTLKICLLSYGSQILGFQNNLGTWERIMNLQFWKWQSLKAANLCWQHLQGKDIIILYFLYFKGFKNKMGPFTRNAIGIFEPTFMHDVFIYVYTISSISTSIDSKLQGQYLQKCGCY